MPWRATGRRLSRPAATTTTPSRSSCRGCSKRSRRAWPRVRRRVEMSGAIVLKDEHLSEARHNLRTPINHILGYGEMLMEDLADQGQEQLAGELGQILDEGRQALAVINAALTPVTNEVAEPEIRALRDDLMGPVSR